MFVCCVCIVFVLCLLCLLCCLLCLYCVCLLCLFVVFWLIWLLQFRRVRFQRTLSFFNQLRRDRDRDIEIEIEMMVIMMVMVMLPTLSLQDNSHAYWTMLPTSFVSMTQEQSNSFLQSLSHFPSSDLLFFPSFQLHRFRITILFFFEREYVYAKIPMCALS